ncbi:unnamed protein product [Kuraishia capsulata CBS 1993]|uniref:Autophagy-related protein 17 n=1 Tax=Kuraishia capsulata CBS 1993 TaxID=1382522 RepID=W6MGM5_9ASCO|nr:uncharacterized protein KUCA_T00000664001 [Kuraishia capsulata CBS 1993]CDK24698.1 unnamed protein product [Kuraishia capsulata CBS 1993]
MEIPTDISNWVIDARQRLSEAEIICGRANEHLLSSTERLSKRDNQLPKLVYLFDSTKQQLRLLGILKDSLVLVLQQLMERKSAISNKLKRDAARLTNIVHSLKTVKVEASFKHSGTTGTLFDFISDEDIQNMVNDIEVILEQNDVLSNGGRTDILLQSFNTDIDSFQHDLDSLHKLFMTSASLPWSRKQKDPQNVSLDKDADSINQLLQMNSELELDMVSLLKSLSNHYDQCSKGSVLLKSPQVPQQEKQELFAVLQNDVNELPSVLDILEDDRAQISQNCEYILNICEQSEKFNSKVQEYVQSLESFGKNKLQAHYMKDFRAGVQPIRANIKRAEEFHKQVLDLIDYYTNFVRSYNSLVLEIDRRHHVNNRIAELVKSLQSSISQIEEDDSKAREDFLLRNADYLPQNIIDPIGNTPSSHILFNALPMVTLEFEKELLPDISTETVSNARMLLKKP